MLTLALTTFFVLVCGFFSEFVATKIIQEQMFFIYLKPHPHIEIDRSNIKTYNINHGKGNPNRQVIIELKDGRKIKSTYSSPECDFDRFIEELDKSIKY